jgi:hypothetical protein
MNTSKKYNRTFHFPWSKGGTSDDKIASSIERLINEPIVITEKMDGSNTSLERMGCFARTHSGPPTHPSFDALKAFHASIKHLIPPDYQLFGEWCYALHSIAYEELPGYFLLFNVRDVKEVIPTVWTSWAEVELWAKEINVPTVPVLFQGTVKSEKELQELIENFMEEPSVCGGLREGVVARVTNEFLDKDFDKCVLKCVRANHVQTSEHWKNQEIVKNKLKINSK